MLKASILENVEFSDGKPNIKVLLESDTTKEIRIAMKQNQEMREHKAPFSIVVEIVDGEIDFGVNGKIENLKKGDLVSLEANVPHSLKAISDTIIRLSLNKKDKVTRVEGVVN